jgi:putative two-component system response regulator
MYAVSALPAIDQLSSDAYVLVVDDDAAVRNLMARILRRARHHVVLADCAEEAIRVVEQQPVAVVLTDVNMPGSMTGLDLIEALHTRRPSLPIIPVTGAADESSLQQALDRGAAGFIKKPFTSGELLEKVDTALSRVLMTEVELRGRLLAPTVASVLANAIEVRDGGMEGHTERLGALALAIGRRKGLSEHELGVLELGAVLHDVGKIGIPDRILLKPGPLTQAERAVIESHSVIGDKMLAPLELLESVRRIVRHHHERWDGGGYPDGLATSEIPLLARIVSVADSIEAMSGPRTYRAPLGLPGVLRQLDLGKGSQWDPEIVDIAIEVIESGEVRVGPGGIRVLTS